MKVKKELKKETKQKSKQKTPTTKPSRRTIRKPHKKITAEKRPRGRPKKVIEVKIPPAPSETPPAERKAEIAPEPLKVEVKLPKIKVNELTTVREIAEKISISPAEIIKKLLSLGTVLTINQR
ncbi:MAG: translation initiation factor IF-2 N-terminal domain-containing protein, partial [Elusimicrobiota bacterium]|nr:translation initiation factor IF-2 N-terminal domain-containing protein [Elusimicrobiota bacterium]